MIKQTCTRRITFEAGHRVYGHENKCANLHGHSYKVFFEAEADTLDNIGRIIDFSVLKERLGGWIDTHWDHAFLWYEKDWQCEALFISDEKFLMNKNFKCPFNPTAEEIAKYLLFEVGPRELFDTRVHLKRVTVWETENCFAVAEL